jgi:hypothetical protein
MVQGSKPKAMRRLICQSLWKITKIFRRGKNFVVRRFAEPGTAIDFIQLPCIANSPSLNPNLAFPE